MGLGEKCKGAYKVAKKCRSKMKDCKRWGHHSVKRWGCADGKSCRGGADAKWGSCSALSVTTGADYCQIDANGCATDGAGRYGEREACTIHVAADGRLTATQFDTENRYDFVTIGGRRYTGRSGPNDVAVTAGSSFTWRSDGSVSLDGWIICWVA